MSHKKDKSWTQLLGKFSKASDELLNSLGNSSLEIGLRKYSQAITGTKSSELKEDLSTTLNRLGTVLENEKEKLLLSLKERSSNLRTGLEASKTIIRGSDAEDAVKNDAISKAYADYVKQIARLQKDYENDVYKVQADYDKAVWNLKLEEGDRQSLSGIASIDLDTETSSTLDLKEILETFLDSDFNVSMIINGKVEVDLKIYSKTKGEISVLISSLKSGKKVERRTINFTVHHGDPSNREKKTDLIVSVHKLLLL